jgi:hypothetical protein
MDDMLTKLDLISNDNPLNKIPQSTYDKFNDFIFSDDLKLTGKLLHRFEHFLNVKDLPGDIVEIGVFKGSGVSSFLKFIQIYCPNSNKKVVGFDIFDVDQAKDILEKDSVLDRDSMITVYDRVVSSDLSKKSVETRIRGNGVDETKFRLVEGDVEHSLPRFLDENPGFRISLLYIDVDLDRPTYYALKYLWDRILPGGVVLFDEYEYHKFSESVGVERFLKERGMDYSLKSTNWVAPTAYLVKKTL